MTKIVQCVCVVLCVFVCECMYDECVWVASVFRVCMFHCLVCVVLVHALCVLVSALCCMLCVHVPHILYMCGLAVVASEEHSPTALK